MAVIYGWFDDAYVAHMDGVRGALRRTAHAGGARAEAVLDAHKPGKDAVTGESKITVTEGDKLDWFVNLDDTAGDRAAAAIEYGRRRGGITSGVHALRSAF